MPSFLPPEDRRPETIEPGSGGRVQPPTVPAYPPMPAQSMQKEEERESEQAQAVGKKKGMVWRSFQFQFQFIFEKEGRKEVIYQDMKTDITGDDYLLSLL